MSMLLNPYLSAGGTLLNELVAWYTLNESGTAACVDAHGNCPNTVKHPGWGGSATHGAGKINNGLVHSSDGGYWMDRNIAGSNKLEFANDFSIAMWLKPAGFTGQQEVMGKTSGGGSGWSIGTTNLSGNEVSFSLRRFVTGTASARKAITAGVWSHIVCTRVESTDAINIYINNGTVTAAVDTTNGAAFQNLWLGQYQNTLYFNGSIDEVGFWSRVLTAGERTELYNSGNGISYGDL